MNNTATITERNSIANFKLGVDSLLEKRNYFAKQILPMLVENKDYYTIKGKKSLGKAGAEKLASIYGLTASFEQDNEVIKSFDGIKGLIAFICNLYKGTQKVGEGRGAAVLKDNGNDPNKTLKMAQKSAFIDSTIRATGLSDIFTQDMETLSPEKIQTYPEATTSEIDNENAEILESISHEYKGVDYQPEMITEKQKKFLTTLIFDHVNGEAEQEKWLSGIDGHTKEEGSELISSLLMSAGR